MNSRLFGRFIIPDTATVKPTRTAVPINAVDHAGSRCFSRNRPIPVRSRLWGMRTNATNSTIVGIEARRPLRLNPKAVLGNQA